MGMLKMFVGLSMSVLFAIAIITFVTNFGTDNGSAVILSQDGTYDDVSANLTSGIQDFKGNSNTSLNTFMTTTQDQGDQSASSGGQFKVGIVTIISSIETILNVGFKSVFGQGGGFGIFLTALITIFTIMMGAYGWKAWKGSPD